LLGFLFIDLQRLDVVIRKFLDADESVEICAFHEHFLRLDRFPDLHGFQPTGALFLGHFQAEILRETVLKETKNKNTRNPRVVVYFFCAGSNYWRHLAAGRRNATVCRRKKWEWTYFHVKADGRAKPTPNHATFIVIVLALVTENRRERLREKDESDRPVVGGTEIGGRRQNEVPHQGAA